MNFNFLKFFKFKFFRSKKQKKSNIFKNLDKTRSFWSRIDPFFSNKNLNEKDLENLEEILYSSDLSPQIIEQIVNILKKRGNTSDIKKEIKKEMINILNIDSHLSPNKVNKNIDNIKINIEKKPSIIMITGINGSGKTTTIGKLSKILKDNGKKVILSPCDTFRAAAKDQLKVWAERSQVDIFNINNKTNDPSAIAYESCQYALKNNYDVVIIDTAGRLNTYKNLMEELKKMKKVIQKVIKDAPHDILLVQDASSGQNNLIQAKDFNNVLNITGIILTKLDGSSKGGVALSITNELKIPIKYIGLGEKIDDLYPFDPKKFIDSIIY